MFTSSIAEIIDGIRYTKGTAPTLHNAVKNFIGIQLDKKTGDAEEKAEQVMSMAKTMYTKNFKNGFDIERFRTSVVLGSAIAGLLLGIGIGVGLDKIGNKYEWYRKRNEHYPRQRY